MAATRLADVIVPEVWNPYIIERTAELSELWQSGVVSTVPELNAFQSEGGNTINMPFWQDLSGASEVLSATGGALAVNPISAEQDVAVVLARGKAWGVNELAAALTGSDPLMAIGNLVAGYWARDMQATLMAILEGVFASLAAESPDAINTLDISSLSGDAAIVGDDPILDSLQLLGDAKGRLSAIMMHSAVETKLKKLDLIEYVQPSGESPRVPMYMDKRVIVDDGMPVSNGVYDTYLFGPGAIGYAEGTNSKVTATETDRDSLAGEDILINRRHFVLHPRGVKYVGAATGGGPTNAVLDDAASWTRVYEAKNIRIARLRHRIAAA
jgi:hypothetical protein